MTMILSVFAHRSSASVAVLGVGLWIAAPVAAQSPLDRQGVVQQLNAALGSQGNAGDCKVTAEGASVDTLRLACPGASVVDLSGAFINTETCQEMAAFGFKEIVIAGAEGEQRCTARVSGCTCDQLPAGAPGLTDDIANREEALKQVNVGLQQAGGSCMMRGEGPQKRVFVSDCRPLALSLQRQFIGSDESCAELHAIGVSELVLIGADGRQSCVTSARGCQCDASQAGNPRVEDITRRNLKAAELMAANQGDAARRLLEETLKIAEAELPADSHPLAQTRVNLASELQKIGDHARAARLYADALPVFVEIMGEGHPHTTLIYANLAYAHQVTDDFKSALALIDRAMPIMERALGPKDAQVLIMLNNQVVMLQEVGDFKRAGPLAERSLKLHVEVFGAQSPETAAALNNLGLYYSRTGALDKALPLYERAVELTTRALGERHENTLQALGNLAGLYQERGDFDKAAELMERVLRVTREVFGARDAQVALALNNLGQIRQAKGEMGAAEPLLKEALELRRDLLGMGHPLTAQSHNNLAAFYHELGQDARALPLARQSLALSEASLGANHPDTAWVCVNLALVLQALGKPDEALPLMERGLSIVQSALGPDHPSSAMMTLNLAQYHQTLGEPGRAIPLYEAALITLERAYGPEHPQIVTLLSNMSMALQKLGDNDRALDTLERAYTMGNKVLGPRHPNMAFIIGNIASLFYIGGEYDQCLKMSALALSNTQAALGPAHPENATWLNNLAVASHSVERDDDALGYGRQAHDLLLAAYGPRNLKTTAAAINLAAIREARGERAEALRLRAEALDSGEQQIGLLMASPSHGEGTRLAFMAELRKYSDALISMALAGDPDEEAVELALTATLQRKGRVLDSMAERLAQLRANLGPDDQARLDRWAEVNTQLATCALSGDTGGVAEALEQELAELDRALAARSDQFRAERQTIDLDGVKAAIPPGAALIEWESYQPFDPDARRGADPWKPPHYAAFALTSEGVAAAVDLGPVAEIDALVDDFRKAILACAAEGGRCAGSLDQTRSSGAALYARAFAPIHEAVKGYQHWLISPAGGLNLIPFEALTDGDVYLIERHLMTYLSSGRDLLRLQSAAGGPHAGKPALIANPDFALGGDGAALSGALRSGGGDVDLTRAQWPPLEGTAAEASAIADLFEGDVARFEGAEAGEGALKGLRGPSILHVATHGFFLGSGEGSGGDTRGFKPLGGVMLTGEASVVERRVDDPLLRSGLVMAGGDGMRGDGVDDGVITARELSAVDLYGTRLAVLSACETGLGEVQAGDGVFGLRRALVLAGAESQVMSLWQVSDDATRALMIAFYRRLLAGQGRSQALRGARLELIAGGELSHPWYWAAFIPSGDWRSLEGDEVDLSVDGVFVVDRGPRGCACQSLSAPAGGPGALAGLLVVLLALLAGGRALTGALGRR